MLNTGCTGSWQNLDVFSDQSFDRGSASIFLASIIKVAPWAEMVMMWVLFQCGSIWHILVSTKQPVKQDKLKPRDDVLEAKFSIRILLISCLFPHVSFHHSTVQFCRTCKSIEANSSLDRVWIPQDWRASC